jgi:hypothetical protein
VATGSAPVGSVKWFRDGLGVWRQATVELVSTAGLAQLAEKAGPTHTIVRPGYSLEMLHDQPPTNERTSK